MQKKYSKKKKKKKDLLGLKLYQASGSHILRIKVYV